MKGLKLKFLLSFLALALFIGYAKCSYAQYMETFGFGAREKSMASAMTAEGSGPSSAFYNPALLTKSKGMETLFGFTFINPQLSLNRLGPRPPPRFDTPFANMDPFNRAKNPRNVYAIEMGLSMPLTKEISFGYVVYLPGTGPSYTRIVNVNDPYFLEYDANPQSMETKLGVAYSPAPWISFGIGTGISVNINSSLYNEFPIGAGDPPPAPAGPLRLDQELEMNWDFGFIGGIWLKPVDWLEFGAVYRQAMSSDLTVQTGVLTDLNDGSGLTAFIPLTLTSDPIYIPEQASFGLSFKPNNRLTVVTDLTFVNWGDYEPPMANFTVGPINDVIFGGDQLPDGSLIIDTVPIPPLGFSDILVPRIGAEYRLLEWLTVRGGYYYRASPVPRQTGITNILDSDTHVLSGGLGFITDDPLQIIKGKIFLDTHFQIMILEGETNTKDSNVAIDDPHNQGLPGYNEGGVLWSIGFTSGIKF